MTKKNTSKKDNGAHYRYTYTKKLTPEEKRSGYVTIKLDPARIFQVYNVPEAPLHAMATGIVKKALRAGRGHKSLEADLKDIICGAERWLEMLEEDGEI